MEVSLLVKCYWTHLNAHSSWFQVHPAARFDSYAGLIPVSLYGDGVQVYRNSEVGNIEVVAWSSDLCFKHGPLERYFLICAYSEHLESEYTFSDLQKVVVDRLCKMVDPDVRHPWAPDFQFAFSSVQGDLKWLLSRHSIHPYTSNFLCSWCLCRKDDPDPGMTVGDFRPEAAHRSTHISHEDFIANTPDRLSFSKSHVHVSTFAGAWG